MNFFTIRKVKWCVINRYKENKGQAVYQRKWKNESAHSRLRSFIEKGCSKAFIKRI